MSTTSDFLKLRSLGTPKTGEWNANYELAMDLAKKTGKFIVTCWSNGESCAYCMIAERCMTEQVFIDWIKKQDAYFVFQYSGDSDKGQKLRDWIFNSTTGIKQFPGFRVSLYDAKGNLVFDKAVTGNDLRNCKTRSNGAKAMTANLEKMFASAPADADPQPAPAADYKVRFNETLTAKTINAILDAIDQCDGYCPCQVKYEGSKCRCEDFVKNKGIGEPCICNLYVKVAKS